MPKSELVELLAHSELMLGKKIGLLITDIHRAISFSASTTVTVHCEIVALIFTSWMKNAEKSNSASAVRRMPSTVAASSSASRRPVAPP